MTLVTSISRRAISTHLVAPVENLREKTVEQLQGLAVALEQTVHCSRGRHEHMLALLRCVVV